VTTLVVAAASYGIAGRLAGGTVVARSARAAVIRPACGPVLVVEGSSGARLPNAVVVADADLAGLALGATVRPGRPARWWDPRPRVGRLDPGAVERARRIAPLAADAVATRGRDDLTALVGLGPGSTPAGDDLLGARLATLRVFGHHAEADRLWAAIDPARTSPLSAALLAHAAEGEVAAPVARLLRALGGAGPVEPAVAAVAALGHTSGPWLLRGVLGVVGGPDPVGA
jgi:Protein of unknown function (DUF2877)